MKNQVVIASISFFVICFLNPFLYNLFSIYSFSGFASLVPCLVNVRAKVQAQVDTQGEQKLVIGTSKTKYCNPKDVRATVHSYRGAKLADLASTVSRYPSQKLNCVTLVAEFSDNSSTVSDFVIDWRFLINLIIHKLNPNVLIILKTILSANNDFINRKFDALNNSLFCPINTF